MRLFRLKSAAIGNAFQALHTFVDPGVRFLIAQSSEEPAEDDEGDPADPAKHLDRQLRRIRRGEDLDRLTILLSRDY